ncbi:MAG TPA: TonB-dependent receptor plug domain-containing protein [Opitutaceae bacterium]|nr:TonB-dependent receptor plug domain-containing protein [Opitutaceae bacterium]
MKNRVAVAAAMLSPMLVAQTAPADSAPGSTEAAKTNEDVVILSPFEVSASAATGYAASTTLAGNRLNTELRDIGSAVSVVTSEFLKDVGATDNRTLLQYTTGSEVGGSYGNFGGHGDGPLLDESSKFISPNTNTRIRGLAAADNTRDFYMTDIPWDGYAVDGVDLQRGANSILFGMGSPAGIINTRSKQAMFANANEATFRIGSYGANRQTLDLNRVLIENQLAVRVAALRNDDQFKQEPAFSKDERLYGALRFEPAFLKRAGMRTILKGNYEVGRVRSNNPRTLPPIDLLTPWFYTGTYQGKDLAGNTVTYRNLNRETFNSTQLTDDNTGRPNHGQIRPAINGGPDAGQPNPYYNPWIGNFAQQYGGPLVYFNNDAPGITDSWILEPGSYTGGISSTGAIDKTIGGIPWQRPGGIAQYADFAKNAGLPYANFGVYKDNSLTDSSIFDFYNQLLDGPNKKEWQDFRTYNVSLAQTFFNDQIGFELAYNKELYKNGRLSLLSGGHQAIYVDINNVYSNGTPAGLNGDPFADGTPNPNVGRAFLSDNGQSNNSSFRSEKEVKRATVFASQDFEKLGKNWFTKFLGKHTVTGLFAADENKKEDRSWIRYTADDAYAAWKTSGNPYAITDNYMVPNTVIYLGDSLINRTTASGAYLPNPRAAQVVLPHAVWTFDSTWNRSTDPTSSNYVDPAAEWINEYYPDIPAFNDPTAASHPRITTQSENPANYVGWVQHPIDWVDSEASAANRAHNTTSARLTRSRVTSNAFVWQGHFLNNAIVGTWGVRKDIAKSWAASVTSSATYGANAATRGVINLSPENYHLPEAYDNRIQMTSHSWMIVAHINDLPGLDRLLKKSPVNVSMFYNESSNFQPSAQRVDLFNQPLSPPTGTTVDKGILLETKDGRFSLKLNKYETASKNVSNESLSGSLWFIGASQTWGGNWANHFQYDWTGDRISDAVPNPDPTATQYNYGPAPGETLEQAQAREAAAVAGWRAWQAKLDPRFYAAWKLDLTTPFTGAGSGLSTTMPTGMAVTEDSISKGYELEVNAQITSNWRLTLNGAKTSAQRNNVGGEALTEFVTAYETALNTTAAGDLRIWWGGPGNETTLYQWNKIVGSNYHMLKLQEGTNVPELRRWRFNLISNYDFNSGLLKGFNVGGGVRYESSIIIGYPVINGEVATQVYYDISNPYRGDGEYNFDFWVGYRRNIWKGIDWSVQLNVRNAFVGNELVPITTQPDGTPAGYRIRPPQTWQLTNTFRF